LTMAIKGKKDTLVDLLLKAGADVNTKSYPSLFAAVDIVSPHLVNRLLQSGANPNSKFLTAEGKVYSNPLLSAIVHEQRSTEIVEALIKAGADLNQICSYKPGAQRTPFQSHDATPFHRLIEQGANAELLALAAKYGADPMIETGGKTAWKLAEPWVARLMVKFFLYPNAVSDAGVYVSLPEHHLVFPVVSRTSDNEAAPSLAAALSSVPKFLSKKQLDGLAPHNDYAHIVRSSGDDRFAQEILVNFTALSSGNVALPPLQWGDVIEFTSASYEDPEEGKRPPQPTGSSKETSTSDKWLTHLKRSSAFMRRHLPMPFELHYGDLQWNLTTGSWGLTDPHSNSVPASSLVDLLRPMWDDPALDRSRIVIERLSDEGGERFTIPVEMSKRYASITLAENDRIILKRLANEDMLEKRRLGVFATQPGSRYFRQVYKKQDPAFPPSLFHLIAAVFDDELLILPHPNLSELT
ncbi:MAG: ankyrin repeat domain-containing protein, partial [Verrucomicrobiales bacterium]